MARIFISGPFSKGDIDTNVGLAVIAAERVSRMGHSPFISHAQGFVWGEFFEHENAFFYKWCNEWLPVCQAVLRIPGESAGADAECELARSLRIPVFYSFEELENYEHEAERFEAKLLSKGLLERALMENVPGITFIDATSPKDGKGKISHSLKNS